MDSRDSTSCLTFLDQDNNFSRDFTVIFLALSALSLAVPFVPLFQRLTCHGKRRVGKGIVETEGASTMMEVVEQTAFLSIPKSYFIHMYIVGSLMSTCCCLYTLFVPSDANKNSFRERSLDSVAIQGMILFEIHCLRRLLECLFITEYGSSSMDISAYFVGIVHYIFTPLCLLFALLQSDSNSFQNSEKRGQTYLRILSLFLYMIGSISQFRSHNILYCLKNRRIKSMNLFNCAGNLKDCKESIISTLGRDDPVVKFIDRDCDKNIGKRNVAYESNHICGDNNSCSNLNDDEILSNTHYYSLPEGFGFEYVSCPHYTSEIIIYISFWVLSPSSVSLLAMTLWVICNLSVVADSQFVWYKKHFPEEIKKRKGWKRIFPYIW